jgi:hypothetical protein
MKHYPFTFLKIMGLIAVLSTLLLLSLSFFKNDFAWELKDENSGLINATRDIIADFYANRSNYLNFIESCSTERNSLIIENYKTISKLNYKRTHNIFFVDNAESFKKILAIMNTETFFYQGYYLVVLTRSSENHVQEIREIFKFCWENKLTRVSLLVSESKDSSSASLYTYLKKDFVGTLNRSLSAASQRTNFLIMNFSHRKLEITRDVLSELEHSWLNHFLFSQKAITESLFTKKSKENF